MIQEQDIVVFQGRGDERLALGQSISHPEKIFILLIDFSPNPSHQKLNYRLLPVVTD